jgi:hypothetical protein
MGLNKGFTGLAKGVFTWKNGIVETVSTTIANVTIARLPRIILDFLRSKNKWSKIKLQRAK